jgi:hypothetical protein
MDIEVSVQEAYSPQRLWILRTVGILVLLSVVAVRVWIDFKTPPLTTGGPTQGALAGGLFASACYSWLLRYYKPTNISVQENTNRIFVSVVNSILILALITVYFVVIFVLLSFIQVLIGMTTGIVFDFEYLLFSPPYFNLILSFLFITTALVNSIILVEEDLDYKITWKVPPAVSGAINEAEDAIKKQIVQATRLMQRNYSNRRPRDWMSTN